MTRTSKILWLAAGTLVLAILSGLMLSVGVMTPLVPMPMHQVLLAWILGYGFIIVLPLCYLISLPLLWRLKAFGNIVIFSALIFASLSVVWFSSSWEFGQKYQGLVHTRIVAIENAIGIAAVLFLAIVGLVRESLHLQTAAYFLIFVMLSWCAFPYLGELP